jgi:hypothetical protein
MLVIPFFFSSLLSPTLPYHHLTHPFRHALCLPVPSSSLSASLSSLPASLFLLLPTLSLSLPPSHPVHQVRREFFPSVMDIVAEIDNGQADTAELLTYQHDTYKGHPRTYTAEEKKEIKEKKEKERKEMGDIDGKSTPSTASHSSESSDLDTSIRKSLDAQAESFLKYSRVLLGAGAKQFYPLDWRALSGVFDNMLPQDQVTLGLSVR